MPIDKLYCKGQSLIVTGSFDEKFFAAKTWISTATWYVRKLGAEKKLTSGVIQLTFFL